MYGISDVIIVQQPAVPNVTVKELMKHEQSVNKTDKKRKLHKTAKETQREDTRIKNALSGFRNMPISAILDYDYQM